MEIDTAYNGYRKLTKHNNQTPRILLINKFKIYFLASFIEKEIIIQHSTKC